MDEQPENTHYTINDTIEEFDFYHPAIQQNIIEDEDEHITTLYVTSAVEPFTGPDTSCNEDINFPRGDWS